MRICEWTYRQPTQSEIWKYLALAGGPYVLELVLAEYFGRPEPASPDRALTAQLLRALVLTIAEGRRSPLEVRAVLDLAERVLASMRARGVAPDPMVVMHVTFLKRVDAWRKGRFSPPGKPVVAPIALRRVDGAKRDPAPTGSSKITA